MFALRGINNNYKDFAGTRSDFVVVGHPEFNLGKERAVYGYPDCWDTTNVRCRPKRNPVAERLRRPGNTVEHLRHLTEVHNEPRPGLKARAFARVRSSPELSGRGGTSPGGGGPQGGASPSVLAAAAMAGRSAMAPLERSTSTSNFGRGPPPPRELRGNFAAFLEDLTSRTLPACGPKRVTAGFGNHSRSQPVCTHYERMRDELAALRVRLRLSPEATRQELLEDGSWRYYAEFLEAARRDEAKVRRTCQKAAPAVQMLATA